MEIIVTAFAALVAAGCFMAIMSKDTKDTDSVEKDDHEQP
jgi:hypothetical protein